MAAEEAWREEEEQAVGVRGRVINNLLFLMYAPKNFVLRRWGYCAYELLRAARTLHTPDDRTCEFAGG